MQITLDEKDTNFIIGHVIQSSKDNILNSLLEKVSQGQNPDVLKASIESTISKIVNEKISSLIINTLSNYEQTKTIVQEVFDTFQSSDIQEFLNNNVSTDHIENLVGRAIDNSVDSAVSDAVDNLDLKDGVETTIQDQIEEYVNEVKIDDRIDDTISELHIEDKIDDKVDEVISEEFTKSVDVPRVISDAMTNVKEMISKKFESVEVQNVVKECIREKLNELFVSNSKFLAEEMLKIKEEQEQNKITVSMQNGTAKILKMTVVDENCEKIVNFLNLVPAVKDCEVVECQKMTM